MKGILGLGCGCFVWRIRTREIKDIKEGDCRNKTGKVRFRKKTKGKWRKIKEILFQASGFQLASSKSEVLIAMDRPEGKLIFWQGQKQRKIGRD